MFYGLDVHKDFIQVCELAADGKRRRDFRIEASAEVIEAFAKTLQRSVLAKSLALAEILFVVCRLSSVRQCLTRCSGV